MKRVLGENWALPILDAHNRDFFAAGVLTLQRCTRCSHDPRTGDVLRIPQWQVSA